MNCPLLRTLWPLVYRNWWAFLSLFPFSSLATGQGQISPPDSFTGTKTYLAYLKYFCFLALFNSTKNTQRVASWDTLSVRSNTTHKSPSPWPHPGALLCPRPSAWPLSIQVCVTSVWNSSHSNAAAAILGFHRGGLEMFKMSSSFHRTEFHSLVELHSDIEWFNDIFLTSWNQPKIIQNFVLALHA